MQLVKLIGSLPFDFTPGTGWSYSNTGFLLLGMVVEKVSGKPLETYLADNFFKPLGLKTLTTTTPQTLVPHRSRGYAFDGKQFLNVAPTNPTLATGAGFLMGTVDDLSKWADSLSPQHALSLSALAAMNTPIRFTDGSEGDYGFGQFLFWDKGVPLIAHGGNTLGFSADLYRIPSRKFSVVILTNAANLDPEPLARHMAAILLPEMDLEKRKPAKDPRPDQTVKLKEWLNTAAKGKVDKTLFAPSFAVRFGALRGLSLLSGISGLGKAVRSLSYLDEDDQAKERRVRYRLEVEGGTAFLEIHWSPADQITTLQVIYSVEKPKPPTVPNAPAKRP